MEQMLTVVEVAAALGVDKQTVYRAIWAGELTWVNLASPGARRARIRVRKSAVEAYLAARTRPAIAATGPHTPPPPPGPGRPIRKAAA